MKNKKNINNDIDFDWDKEVVFSYENTTEILTNDKLNRRPYAEYLYFYLKEQGKEKNTVINLNAEWGAGKTFFVKRLYTSLKKKHPCIYIDAWKQDYSDDAFLTLFSSLITQIEKYAGRLDSRLIDIGDALGRFTKGIVPEILSGIAKEYIGIDSMSDISKKAAELMLSEHQKKSEAMQTLRKELSFWTELSFKKGFEAPVFIFIDELDRCRPHYAISLLEIVKHFFDLEKFVFIISTDTNQLQHSIKNLYGNDFAANDYLGRFFHRRFSLRSPNVAELVFDRMRQRSVDEDFDLDLFEVIYPRPTSAQQFSFNLSAIFNAFDLNIRDVIKNVDRIIDMLLLGMFKKKVDYIFLAMLMVIYEKERDFVEDIFKNDPILDGTRKTLATSKNLNNFAITRLVLEIDSSIRNTGIEYYSSGTVDNRHRNRFQNEKVSILTIDYIELFLNFILKFNNSRDRLRNEIDNPYLMLSSKEDGSANVKIHYASIYANQSPVNVYKLQSYIDFIELATSFE